MTGEKFLWTMQGIGIFIHRSFIRKFLILDCAKMVSKFWISEQEPVFYQEICIRMAENGLGQIFQKSKLSRQNDCLPDWILHTKQSRRKI